MTHLGPLLERAHIERRLVTARNAQLRAELIGDTKSAERQAAEVDALLEALTARLTQ